ncbi:MAG: UvrD-helicase domain-containing protein [Parcubacteria group bacterium]
MSIISDSNEQQKSAIMHGDGPMLIVAGAGTGKTRVITARIAWLITEKNANVDEVLALTFTDKAAQEMEERIDLMLPYGYVDLWVSTFHAFADKLIKRHAIDIGLPNNYKLLDETEAWLLVRKNLDRFNLDYYRPIGNPAKFIHALLKHFSRCKDEGIYPQSYLDYAEEIKLNSDSTSFVKQFDLSEFNEAEKKELIKSEIMRIGEVANAYHVYQQILLENDSLDFGDLLMYAVKLLRERPLILNKYRKQFKYILVDEFQDTNFVQYELIKLLAGPKKNINVVGDDDQCLPGDSLIMTKHGNVRIDKIVKGNEVATAVGKGYLSYSKVNHVNKNKKTVKLITFKTKSGREIAATSNHKMFCYNPVSYFHHFHSGHEDKQYYYVYLMQKQELGWRLGITNDLSVRLRLERSADKIVAVKSCENEEEARYMETLLSLKYGIPTVCFQERDGIMTKRKWSEKLYRDLNVEEGVRRLAKDFNIDLDSHQFCLDAVNRGDKVRIKINLELCQRNYRSKHTKGIFLQTPQVLHCLSLETSHKPTIDKLKKMGFVMQDAKKSGKRLRIASADLPYLGKIAKKIQNETGGIIEHYLKAGKAKSNVNKALVMPTSNVLKGMFLPVVTKKGIIYDQIIDRKEKEKTIFVYDLEVDRTHNYVANGILVHNSIYKFRGASISNIMQFKEDFPEAKEVVLTENFRSCQEILDLAYKFIVQNNPYRLEAKLGIDKKLKSNLKENCCISHIHKATGEDEARFVVDKIIELQKRNNALWSDFAILVRANDTANIFINLFEQANIPYQFLAMKGLYNKPIVLDILNYFKMLDNYHESSAVFRVLNFEFLHIAPDQAAKLAHYAKEKTMSLFEAVKQAAAIPGITPETLASLNKIIVQIEKDSAIAKMKKPSEILLSFMYNSGYLAHVQKKKEREVREEIDYLNQFLKKIQQFETNANDPRLKDLMELFKLEQEAGESGRLIFDLETGPETVKIMTIHSAKGLEYPYVFIPNLVDRKFPTDERTETISIPDALIKENIPEGDFHLEEERRLFYVAMTRAKRGLYFSSADNYGGAREKKLSRFLTELGYKKEEYEKCVKKDQTVFDGVQSAERKGVEKEFNYELPKSFSFSQMRTYENCPLQYKFANILKIQTFGGPQLTFGSVIHAALQKFLEQCSLAQSNVQPDLFVAKEQKPNIEILSLENLYKIYDECWSDDWYENKAQKEDYYKKGKEHLKNFHQTFRETMPAVKFLEQTFHMKIGDCNFSGRIDRIDDVDNGKVEIIDYKTGKAPDESKLSTDDRRQLVFYQIAAEEVLKLPVASLKYYYLDENKFVPFIAKENDKIKLKERFLENIEQIKKQNFAPCPSQFVCQYCGYKDICEYKKI